MANEVMINIESSLAAMAFVVADQQEELKEMREALADEHKTTMDYKKMLDDANCKVETQNAQMLANQSEAQKTINELIEKLRKATDDYENMARVADELRSQGNNPNYNEIADLKSCIEQLEKGFASSRSANDVLQKEINLAHEMITSKDEHIAALQAEVEELKYTLKETDNKLEELRGSLNKQEDDDEIVEIPAYCSQEMQGLTSINFGSFQEAIEHFNKNVSIGGLQLAPNVKRSVVAKRFKDHGYALMIANRYVVTE